MSNTTRITGGEESVAYAIYLMEQRATIHLRVPYLDLQDALSEMYDLPDLSIRSVKLYVTKGEKRGLLERIYDRKAKPTNKDLGNVGMVRLTEDGRAWATREHIKLQIQGNPAVSYG